MKIHAMCIIKDEADIVSECLTAAAGWCDHIYVFDNGSADGTWEIVQELAERIPAVVAWKSDPAPFSDGLRAQIFNAFSSAAAPGDWWCRADADEFYIDDPRVFLRKVPAAYDVVWTASFSYYFTDRDAEAYAADPERYGDDVPVEEKIRHYVNHWGEPRFFRHRDGLRWNERDGGFPAFVETSAGYPVRIWLKHFPYRSPQQIERRLAARNQTLARGEFAHEAIADWGSAVGAVKETRSLMERTGAEFATTRWQDRIVPAASLELDAHDRRLVANEDLMPPIPIGTTAAGRARAGARRVAGAARRALRRR
jgi:glycosyltransferase involved in cell wall biosynthesis